jgi:hypothetical protein
MKRLVVLSVLLATAAHADTYYPYAASPGPAPTPAPKRELGYVGGGAGLSADHFLNAFLDVEGGLRLGTAPLWVRGSLGYGASADFEGGGDFLSARVGLESRTCASHGLCLFGGLDVGGQRQTWSKYDEMTEHHKGFIYGARVGLDAGGEALRFRLALDSYRYARSSDVDGLPNDPATKGIGLSLAIIHRL